MPASGTVDGSLSKTGCQTKTRSTTCLLTKPHRPNLPTIHKRYRAARDPTREEPDENKRPLRPDNSWCLRGHGGGKMLMHRIPRQGRACPRAWPATAFVDLPSPRCPWAMLSMVATPAMAYCPIVKSKESVAGRPLLVRHVRPQQAREQVAFGNL